MILEAIEQSGASGVSIRELASITGIHRTSIYRFIDVLLTRKYIRHCPERNRYLALRQRITPKTQSKLLFKKLKGVLASVSQRTGDSSFLIRKEGSDSLCVHHEQGTYPVQVLAVATGHRQPLGVGAAGLALLSFLPDEEISEVLHSNQAVLSKFGNMNPDKMRAFINATKERGWSVIGNAAVPGVLGVGIPVLDWKLYPIFAISVSSITARMSLMKQADTAKIIREELKQNDILAAIPY